MGILQHLQKWSDSHHPRWLVILRVALGLSLFVKGISFIRNMGDLELLLSQSSLRDFSSWIALVITCIHLLGGFLIIIGLLTRWAVLIQLPVLLGAIFFIHPPFAETEFIFALLLILLLILFFVEGGGPFSLDNYFLKHPK
ncbi:MAG: DoxX family protein [Chitinophagaceae bacterium]|nr:DoxX family protein [Chitinophagaceae bacterium]